MSIESTSTRGDRRAREFDQGWLTNKRRMAERLLPAVEGLLEAANFRELSVDQIVDEAGISRSTFYNYFEDKSDLLRMLTADTMGSIIIASQAWWALPARAGKEAFAVAMGNIAATYTPHARLMTAVAESASQDDGVREAFLSFMSEGARGIEGYIRREQEAGSITAELDPAQAAHWLTWMMESGLSRLGRPDQGYSRDRILDALVELTWRALHG